MAPSPTDAAKTVAGLPRTVFVLCPSWHGATLLSLVLGNHSRAFSLGDTIPRDDKFRCRCGAQAIECPFWTAVVRAVGEGGGDSLIPARPRLFSSNAINQAAVAAISLAALKGGVPAPFRRFAAANARFLGVCRGEKDFDLFVDGYKSLIRYLALKADGRQEIAGLIHVLRDPRAFAAAAKLKGVSVGEACRGWVAFHRRVDTIVRLTGERALTLRYEDFCAEPEKQLATILDWLNLPREPLLRPIPKPSHWVGSRSMDHFDGTIRLTERWRDELSKEELASVIRIAGPEARRRGYSLGSA